MVSVATGYQRCGALAKAIQVVEKTGICVAQMLPAIGADETAVRERVLTLQCEILYHKVRRKMRRLAKRWKARAKVQAGRRDRFVWREYSESLCACSCVHACVPTCVRPNLRAFPRLSRIGMKFTQDKLSVRLTLCPLRALAMQIEILSALDDVPAFKDRAKLAVQESRALVEKENLPASLSSEFGILW